MIWSVVTKEEMDSCITPPTFKDYQSSLGIDNISLAVVKENDCLDFVSKEDIILLRSIDETIISRIKEKGIKTTAEEYKCYKLSRDKSKVGAYLREHGVNAPQCYGITEIKDNCVHFVKPRYGNDSIGISAKSICKNTKEVNDLFKSMSNDGMSPIIEDYIEGREYTVACIMTTAGLRTFPIGVDCELTKGIQTYYGKSNYVENGFKVGINISKRLSCIAEKSFSLLELKHHARIDFREDKSGNLYVIDINLIPGLSQMGDLARCLYLTEGISYTESLNMVIESAT